MKNAPAKKAPNKNEKRSKKRALKPDVVAPRGVIDIASMSPAKSPRKAASAAEGQFLTILRWKTKDSTTENECSWLENVVVFGRLESDDALRIAHLMATFSSLKMQILWKNRPCNVQRTLLKRPKSTFLY